MVDFNVPWFDVYDQHGQMRSLCCLEKQCKEMVRSEGRYMELKRIDKNNIPSISIDGDGVDRRNGQDGQNKTRLEAFFEMIKDN